MVWFPVWFAVALSAGLLALLLLPGRREIDMGWFSRLEQALTPDFDGGNNGPDLTRAFRLLTRLLIAFVLAMALWSLAAAALDAVHIAGAKASGVAPMGAAWTDVPLWLLALGGTLALSGKLFGAIALLALAAWLIGGFLGFLFGLPSRIGQEGGGTAIGGAGGVGGASTSGGAGGTATAGGQLRWAPSTNLIQISDWLTKTIVGVSLVEAKQAYGQFATLCADVSRNLLGGAFASGAVVPAVLIAAGILGFKYCNLYTLLCLARLIKEAGDTVSSLTRLQKVAVGTMSQLSSTARAIADPIEVTNTIDRFAASPATATPSAALTTEQRAAAVEFGRKRLEDLSTYDTVLAWARARAVLNDYPAAAQGYRKLIPLMQPQNPVIMGEAARVFAQTGAYAEAKAMLKQALTLPATAAQRVPLLRDHCSLALYDPKPAGYTEVLERLADDAAVDADATGELRLLRACARGQKYGFDNGLGAEEKTKLLTSAIEDLRMALVRGQNPDWVRYLADPHAAGKPPPGSPDRDDDLEPFWENNAFQQLLTTAPATRP